MAWDQNNKKEATQEMFVVLLGPDDQLIASVGIYDEWIRYKGVKFTSLAENDYMTSIDSLSHKATHDVIKVTRWGKEVDVRWNDWLFATGKSDIPLAKVQLVFGTYPATINRLDTTFGEQSLKRYIFWEWKLPRKPPDTNLWMEKATKTMTYSTSKEAVFLLSLASILNKSKTTQYESKASTLANSPRKNVQHQRTRP